MNLQLFINKKQVEMVIVKFLPPNNISTWIWIFNSLECRHTRVLNHPLIKHLAVSISYITNSNATVNFLNPN